MKLSTKATIFKRVSMLIEGISLSIGQAPSAPSFNTGSALMHITNYGSETILPAVGIAVTAEDLRFDSRTGQIGHSGINAAMFCRHQRCDVSPCFADVSPERCFAVQALSCEDGSRHSLHASA